MNTGCQSCKWAKNGYPIRDLFHLSCVYTTCNFPKHPLFKERKYDHKGCDRGVKAIELIITIAKGECLPASVREIEEDCLMNINFNCPLWHKRYTEFTNKDLEELKLDLKIGYIL